MYQYMHIYWHSDGSRVITFYLSFLTIQDKNACMHQFVNSSILLFNCILFADCCW